MAEVIFLTQARCISSIRPSSNLLSACRGQKDPQVHTLKNSTIQGTKRHLHSLTELSQSCNPNTSHSPVCCWNVKNKVSWEDFLHLGPNRYRTDLSSSVTYNTRLNQTNVWQIPLLLPNTAAAATNGPNTRIRTHNIKSM